MQLIRFIIIWLFLSLINWLNANAQLVINEYSTANLNTVADNFGQYEDWFEIYNAGSVDVPLTGYYLSNKFINFCLIQISQHCHATTHIAVQRSVTNSSLF